MRSNSEVRTSGPTLQALGLSPVAERAYRALLDDPPQGVEELSAQLDLSPREIWPVLDELTILGLVRPSADVPGVIRPVSPEVGLQALIAQRQADLERRQLEITEGRLAVARMVQDNLDRIRPDQLGAERLLGMDAVRARIESLAVSTQRECLSFMPGRAQSKASLDASRPLDAAALRRGVVLRTVYQDSVRNDPATLDYAQWLMEAGGEVRTVPVLPSRLLIVDSRTALVPIDPGHSRVGAMELTGGGAVACLHALFDLIWETATPLGGVPEPDHGGLTAQEKELLRLLGQGLTDEAAANKLGVSQRTARRMMAGLMALLGARSRFEAGVLAAQRGWL